MPGMTLTGVIQYPVSKELDRVNALRGIVIRNDAAYCQEKV